MTDTVESLIPQHLGKLRIGSERIWLALPDDKLVPYRWEHQLPSLGLRLVRVTGLCHSERESLWPRKTWPRPADAPVPDAPRRLRELALRPQACFAGRLPRPVQLSWIHHGIEQCRNVPPAGRLGHGPARHSRLLPSRAVGKCPSDCQPDRGRWREPPTRIGRVEALSIRPPRQPALQLLAHSRP